jgi:hypothetical protein
MVGREGVGIVFVGVCWAGGSGNQHITAVERLFSLVVAAMAITAAAEDL